MKVTIEQKTIYHKCAEIEVEIPDDITSDDILDYLLEDEEWEKLMSKKIREAKYKMGYYDGYFIADCEHSDAQIDFRYYCPELKMGGHL